MVRGQDDAGKRVTVNSSGGAIVGVKGTVVVGPYTYQYVHRYKVTPKTDVKDRYGRERVKYKEEVKTSSPMWLVAVEGYDRDFSFAAAELLFG